MNERIVLLSRKFVLELKKTSTLISVFLKQLMVFLGCIGHSLSSFHVGLCIVNAYFEMSKIRL